MLFAAPVTQISASIAILDILVFSVTIKRKLGLIIFVLKLSTSKNTSILNLSKHPDTLCKRNNSSSNSSNNYSSSNNSSNNIFFKMNSNYNNNNGFIQEFGAVFIKTLSVARDSMSVRFLSCQNADITSSITIFLKRNSKRTQYKLYLAPKSISIIQFPLSLVNN